MGCLVCTIEIQPCTIEIQPWAKYCRQIYEIKSQVFLRNVLRLVLRNLTAQLSRFTFWMAG